MAKVRSGILSKVLGKVGGVVGASWRGRNYLREYVIPKNPKTAAQMAQRAKMRAIMTIAKQILGQVIRPVFAGRGKYMSEINAFVAQNIAHMAPPIAFDRLTFGNGDQQPVSMMGTTGYEGGAEIRQQMAVPQTPGNTTEVTAYCIIIREKDLQTSVGTLVLPQGLDTSSLSVFVTVKPQTPYIQDEIIHCYGFTSQMKPNGKIDWSPVAYKTQSVINMP